MNLLCNVSTFQPQNICFLETKKNMVIDGNFTKIIYSDAIVSLNGLYISCPLESSQVPNFPMTGKNPHSQSFSGVTQVKPTTLATYQENGVTIVTRKCLFVFAFTNTTNIHLIKELNRIEHEIIEYYKEFFCVNKANTYSLRTQLKTGSLKVIQKLPVTSVEKGVIDPLLANLPMLLKPIVIKISGIWETDTHVGITFKFQM